MWRQPNSHELEVYEYQRHIFGARDSTACANFVLQQTAKGDIEDHPNSLEIIQRTFYMDDIVVSFSDTITAFTTANVVKDTLQKGKLNLTKWCSNSREFCQQMQTISVEELFSKRISSKSSLNSFELGRRQNNVQSERQKELGPENKDTTQASVFCLKFLRSFGNHISTPHPSKDFTARTMDANWTKSSIETMERPSRIG